MNITTLRLILFIYCHFFFYHIYIFFTCLCVRGQWRDTVPPVAEKLTFRFTAADFKGETILHCHFLRHEDLGMMDSYLVTDYESYVQTAPTVEPTASPSAGVDSSSSSSSSKWGYESTLFSYSCNMLMEWFCL